MVIQTFYSKCPWEQWWPYWLFFFLRFIFTSVGSIIHADDIPITRCMILYWASNPASWTKREKELKLKVNATFYSKLAFLNRCAKMWPLKSGIFIRHGDFRKYHAQCQDGALLPRKTNDCMGSLWQLAFPIEAASLHEL